MMATNFTTDKAYSTAVAKCSDNIKRFIQGLNAGSDPYGEYAEFPINWGFLDALGCCQKDGDGKYFRVLDFYNSTIGETQSGSWRSYDQQQKLYEIGRNIGYKKNFGVNLLAPKFLRGAWVAYTDVKKTGSVVTNLSGGASYHNYGLAIDIVLRHFGETVASNKVVTYNGVKYDTLEKIYRKAGLLKWAEMCSLTWGGLWSNFPDVAHFQDTAYKPLPYKVYINTCLQNKSNCSFESCKEFWNSSKKGLDFQEWANKTLDISGKLSEEDEKMQSWIDGKGDTYKYDFDDGKKNWFGFKVGIGGLLAVGVGLFLFLGTRKRR